jgi:hypothetical protein
MNACVVLTSLFSASKPERQRLWSLGSDIDVYAELGEQYVISKSMVGIATILNHESSPPGKAEMYAFVRWETFICLAFKEP